VKSAVVINEKYVVELYQKLLKGDRLALAKSITLVESQNKNHVIYAQHLIEKCLLHSGNSIRIGITGTPGVGKSTFIESLGQMFIKNGSRLSVLTIDPTSPLNKGSILGDKSRMEVLSHDPNAFVRTSPSRSVLGGTTDCTRETIILCESAGFDVTIVETVGIGQSETEILKMVDLLILLVQPGSGDEIQGIKRGIIEVADIIVVNKEDRFNKATVKETLNTFKFAIHLKSMKRSGWATAVMSCSALAKTGMDEVFNSIMEYFKVISENGFKEKNRANQNNAWLDQKVESSVVKLIREQIPKVESIDEIRLKVEKQELSVFKAAEEITHQILKDILRQNNRNKKA